MTNQSIVFDFLPRAERLARQHWRLLGGPARGVDLDDVLGEVNVTLCKLAQIYDERLGKVVTLLDTAIPRTVQACFRARASRAEGVDLEQVPEPSAAPSQERELTWQQVEKWKQSSPAHAQALEALEHGQRLRAPQRQLIAGLRQQLGASAARKVRQRRIAASRAAQLIGQPVRRVRELCESGELPAERSPANDWLVRRRDVLRLRQKRILRALQEGATQREAVVKTGSSAGAVSRAAKRLPDRLPLGRRPIHDRAEILAALTDETRAPHVWRNGHPCLRAVARHVGCDERQVRRVYGTLRTNDPHVAQRR